MKKHGVMETPPSKWKRGGPEPHKRFQRDGTGPDDPLDLLRVHKPKEKEVDPKPQQILTGYGTPFSS